MNAAPRTSSQWALQVAIADANADPSGREAPWYGPWNLVLQDFLFRGFGNFPYLTVTYPQYPVSNTVDIEDGSEFDFDEPVAIYTDRSAAPSPEVFSGSRHLLPLTPPKALPRQASASKSPAGSMSPPASSSEAPIPKIRSTRIPDFVQRLHQLKLKDDHSPCIPPIFRTRIFLIVEIKKVTVSPNAYSFLEIHRQTDIQARHVFTSASLTTDIVGVIAAFGDLWTYGEYYREDFSRPSPSPSEQRDPTYHETSLPPNNIIRRDYRPFALHLQARGLSCLLLDTPDSDQGLQIVRKRLHQVCFGYVSH
jgi:hypothetical protein